MFLTQPKFRSVFSAAALVVLSACTVFAKPPGCTTIANERFTVAASFSGRLLQQIFNGTSIDLLALHEIAIRDDSGMFNGQSSLLLLSYNDGVIELPYNVDFEAMFARRAVLVAISKEVNLTSLTVSNFNAPGTSNNSIPAAFGKVDPSTVTHFQDVVFGNGKMFNITSKTFVDTIDERISYAPGSHFDLKNPISVAGSNDSGTLIGVVSGKPIYREPCMRLQKKSFLVDCTKKCQEANFNEGDFCFFMDGCEIAHGPQALFASVAVVPAAPVDFATLPPLPITSTAAVSTTASTPVSSVQSAVDATSKVTDAPSTVTPLTTSYEYYGEKDDDEEPDDDIKRANLAEADRHWSQVWWNNLLTSILLAICAGILVVHHLNQRQLEMDIDLHDWRRTYDRDWSTFNRDPGMYGRNFNRDQEWRSMLDHEVIPALPRHSQPKTSEDKKRASAGKDAASKPKEKKDKDKKKKKSKVSRSKIPAAVRHEPRPEPEGQPEEVPRLPWTPEREYASVCLWRGGRILRQYQGRRMPPAAEREFNRLFAVVYEQEVRDMEDRVRLTGAAHAKSFIVEEREEADACREGDTVK